MARNSEIVRQWNLLRTIEASRHGVALQRLIEVSGVTRRTVYRDLDALQEAGFPLLSEQRDGRVFWKLSDVPFESIDETGFSLSELCALYLSRRMLEVLTGAPFQAPLQRVFGRLEMDLPPKMRRYLDGLPSALAAMPAEGRITRSVHYEAHVSALLQATLDRREVEMVYDSRLSQRTKTYRIRPYRVVYAHGGMYLFAFVPEYDQVRTFAIQRVRKVKPLDIPFVPAHELPDDPFGGSLGPNLGQPTVPVILHFDATIASALRERVFHPTQRTDDLEDGSLRMYLDVCNDWWLHSWILGFGPLVHVESPPDLVAHIVGELERARTRYARTALDDGPVSPAMMAWGLQGRLADKHDHDQKATRTPTTPAVAATE